MSSETPTKRGKPILPVLSIGVPSFVLSARFGPFGAAIARAGCRPRSWAGPKSPRSRPPAPHKRRRPRPARPAPSWRSTQTPQPIYNDLNLGLWGATEKTKLLMSKPWQSSHDCAPHTACLDTLIHPSSKKTDFNSGQRRDVSIQYKGPPVLKSVLCFRGGERVQ